MRRVGLLIALIVLSGCTLSLNRDQNSTPRVVTATLGFSLEQIATPAAVTPVSEIVILPTTSPSETATQEVTVTPAGTSLTPGDTPDAEATVEAIVEGTLNAMAA